ncbi:glycosyltransferase family 4 protein [Cyclobacterium jeungdonense]|uniref:Glycosyltransferase family 4 protein n=1 Tax=Cyclobacterium jeungdonense TaxID=708087 RepID=A0ABT8CDU8_9BACT|nr:glycosyltransferase family 4 protein [Cyclobacterium jeungdonense]MDN3690572.1 glycosyltransferase family 4 protein [Cyclobacterium jeungdonense]
MNILFISWDSDQTNYLENLFIPIFEGIQKKTSHRFQIMQFSWARPQEVARICLLAEKAGIGYLHIPVSHKPNAALGSLWSLIRGSRKIKNHLRNNEITCLMPRSTLPGWMVLRLGSWLKSRSIPVVFDADGFPIQERVDFAGLNPGSFHYRWLRQVERRMVQKADRVLTRSERAIDIHLDNTGIQQREKFYPVINGRDPGIFRPDTAGRTTIRKKLGISESTCLWLYSGSLGPQYLVPEMLQLFWSGYQKNPDSRFLFLVRNKQSLQEQIPEYLQKLVFIETVPFDRIPDYYAAADLGLSLRKPAPSLAGLAPIKIGEYLLSGLPVVLSPEIGDLSDKLAAESACFIYRENPGELMDWLESSKHLPKTAIRKLGERHFGLEQSVVGYIQALQNL